MPNIAYFEIPADNVDRAKHFYQSLFDWKIDPMTMPGDMNAMGYQSIITGEPVESTLNIGDIHKRQMPAPITCYVHVEEFEKTLAKVEKLGGKFIMPKTEIESVGVVAIIADTEGNVIGLWKRGRDSPV